MAMRDYEGDGIVIHWDSERCQHSGRCVQGSPTVFDAEATPWVQAGATGADEIAATIDTCVSGALTYTRTDGAAHGRRGYAAGEDPTEAQRPDPPA